MKASTITDQTGSTRIVLCCEKHGFAEALDGLLDDKVGRESAQVGTEAPELLQRVVSRDGEQCEAFRQVVLFVPDSDALPLSCVRSPTVTGR